MTFSSSISWLGFFFILVSCIVFNLNQTHFYALILSSLNIWILMWWLYNICYNYVNVYVCIIEFSSLDSYWYRRNPHEKKCVKLNLLMKTSLWRLSWKFTSSLPGVGGELFIGHVQMIFLKKLWSRPNWKLPPTKLLQLMCICVVFIG